jgi:hypothetical protein
MDELVPGIILPETRDRLMNIIKSLKIAPKSMERFWAEQNCP